MMLIQVTEACKKQVMMVLNQEKRKIKNMERQEESLTNRKTYEESFKTRRKQEEKFIGWYSYKKEKDIVQMELLMR